MADVSTVIIEGALKYRDGKKWKQRWCIVRKLSPVADCLQLQLYRDIKDKGKLGSTKASLSLENFLGCESSFTLDKECNTLAVICKELIVVVAFDTRESLIEWQVKINTHLGEGQHFNVDIAHVPAKSRILLNPARLHVVDGTFCLSAGLPPKLLGIWQLEDLRRYGVVSGKFCFEGGSRCNRGEGLHVLISSQADQITSAFDLASHGKLCANKRPFVRKETGVANAEHRTPSKHTTWTLSTTACSSESSRPLLNSSDSSSTCDGSSEVLLHSIPVTTQTPHPFNVSEGIVGPASRTSDEFKENYTWLSHGSTDGRMSVNNGDLDSTEISRGHVFSREGCGTATMMGRCLTCAGGSTLNVPVDSTRAYGGAMLSPTWTANEKQQQLQRQQCLSEVSLLNCQSLDRDAVSVSSHGSNSSGGSNVSEYLTPRNIAECLYDRPRTILPHVCCPLNTQKTDACSHQLFATCQQNQLVTQQLINTKQSLDLFVSHSVCSCQKASCTDAHTKATSLSRVHGHHPNVSLCCSPLPSPSNATTQLSMYSNGNSQTSSPRKRNSVMRSGKACGHESHCRVNSDHSSHLWINPYGNYDVPKPTVCCHTQKMELQDTRLNFPMDVGMQKTQNRSSVVSSDGSDYDVPRRIKDCLQLEGNAHYGTADGLPGNVSVRSLQSLPHCCVYQMKQPHVYRVNKNLPETVTPPVCACQRVMHWAENLLACRHSKGKDDDLNEPVLLAHCNSAKTSDIIAVNEDCGHHFVEAKVGSDGSSVLEIVQHCTCTKLLLKPGSSYRSLIDSASANPNTNDQSCGGESVTHVTENYPVPTSYLDKPGDTSSPSSCYANMEFVKSLGLYENASAVVSGLMDVSANTSEPGVFSSAKAERSNFQIFEGKEDGGGVQHDKQVSSMVSQANHVCCSHCHILQEQQQQQHSVCDNYMMVSSLSHNPLDSVSHKMAPASNYLMMQPLSQKRTPESTNLRGSDVPAIPASGTAESLQSQSNRQTVELSFRPFMPHNALRPSETWLSKCPKKNIGGGGGRRSYKHCTLPLSSGRNLETGNRTRSNSLVELKRRVFLKKRSSSADSRQEEKVNSRNDLNENVDNMTTMSMDNNKESWPSAEDIAKAIDLSISSRSLENQDSNYASMSPPSLLKDRFVDGQSCSLDIPSAVNSEYARTLEHNNVKRSSSVPCKPGNRDSASSSDSGVSTGSPKQILSVNVGNAEEYVEKDVGKLRVTSCPPYALSKGGSIICQQEAAKAVGGDGDPSVSCGEAIWLSQNTAKGQHLGEHSPVPMHDHDALGQQLCSVDSKSTTSSTMSDMSDYIETLSLSSHGSDSQEHQHYHSHGLATNTLRPRSCREYQKVDRSILVDSVKLANAENGAADVCGSFECKNAGDVSCASSAQCHPRYGSKQFNSSTTLVRVMVKSDETSSNIVPTSSARLRCNERNCKDNSV